MVHVGCRRMEAYVPLAEYVLGPNNTEAVAFYTGTGDAGILSDVCGLLVSWTFFYVGTVSFYHIFAPLAAWYARVFHPDRQTNKVPAELQNHMVETSHIAFPLYVCVPLIGEFARKKGWERSCSSVEECGGWPITVAGCIGYFVLAELLIFLDHYYLLHKVEAGKRTLNHAKHHMYKHADQLNGWSGFAFEAQDGFSQGIQLVVATFFVPVHIGFVLFCEIFVAFWTIYIHTDILPLPWPFMGCDYHYLHHKYNWYNFGFVTVFWDTIFKTVKHPGPKDYLPPTAFELKHSKALLEKVQADKAKKKST